jgi:RimJ/RimL family protein N-acetyltransferase
VTCAVTPADPTPPDLDDALGPALRWTAVRPPAAPTLQGRTVRLEPLDPARHAAQLYAASHGPGIDPRLWLYMSVGPFADEAAFAAWLTRCAGARDPLFVTVADPDSGRARGLASFMRITPEHGAIEIGNILFGPALQRTTAATEAIFLMARHVFDDLGYRRLEWKCNARNAPSRRAALRFGFAYEGLFRHHMVIKDRSRDTAWFAMVGDDWPAIRAAFAAWLDPANFDAAGRQRRSLEAIRDGRSA